MVNMNTYFNSETIADDKDENKVIPIVIL